MSLPSGVGHPSTISPAIEQLNRKGVKTSLPQPAPERDRQQHSHPMQPPKFSGMSSLISAIPVHPKIQDAFLQSAREGPYSIILPESSVIVGRSAASFKRGGWLELQERLPEEITVALIWLFGVDKLQSIFENRLKSKLFPGLKHMSTHIAWNRTLGKTTHVDLTAQEMFAKNQQEISALLKMKSARWLFSVGLALAGVGYVVPKLNQWKTNLVLQYLGRRKRNTEGSNVQFGDPTTQQPQTGTAPSQRTPLSPTFRHPGQITQQTPNSVYPTITNQFQRSKPNYSNPSHPIYSGVNPSSQTQGPLPQQSGQPSHPAMPGKKDIQFGGLPGGSLIQSIGHLVEQTPYGSILVVDAGIAGGRGYVASKRSLFETAEVLVRDIGSLYFYILCAPHLMKALGAGMDKAFDTSIAIQPKVADAMHQAIQKTLGNVSAYNPNAIRAILTGADDKLMEHEGFIKRGIRQAPKEAFQSLLEREVRVYLPDPKKSAGLAKQIMEFINTKAGKEQAAHIAPGQILKLLSSLKEGNQAFATLSPMERQNLSIAVKQAFRHTAGISLDNLSDDAIRKHPNFKNVFKALGKGHPEENSLLSRIRRMAQLDALDQSHSMLRRSLTALRDPLSTSPQLREQGNALADWLDQAIHRRVNLSELIHDELDGIGSKLDAMKLSPAEKEKLGSLLKNPSFQSLQEFKNALTGIAKDSANPRFRLGPVKSKAAHAQEAIKELDNLKTLLGQEAHADLATAAQRNIRTYMAQLSAKATQGSAEHTLLTHYEREMGELLQGKGRLFSLAIHQDDPVLGQKAKELLKGGLQNDSRFLAKALDIVGQLDTDSRKFSDATKAVKMRDSIINYAEALIKKTETLGTGETLEKGMRKFYQLNSNLHYGAWTFSLAGTMFCLGWLVPKVQNTITKRLTGKDKNPGIASAEDAQENSEKPSEPQKSPAAASPFNTGGQIPHNPETFKQNPYMAFGFQRPLQTVN